MMIATQCTDIDRGAGLQQRHVAPSREARIRAIVGAGGQGSLPRVNGQSLRRYCGHLLRHLSFPFQAEYHEDAGPHRGSVHRVIVTGLIDPLSSQAASSTGVLCRASLAGTEIIVPLAELELADESVNARLIDDYWYWVWNWR